VYDCLGTEYFGTRPANGLVMGDGRLVMFMGTSEDDVIGDW